MDNRKDLKDYSHRVEMELLHSEVSAAFSALAHNHKKKKKGKTWFTSIKKITFLFAATQTKAAPADSLCVRHGLSVFQPF